MNVVNFHSIAAVRAALDQGLADLACAPFALSLQRYFPHPVTALGVANGQVAHLARRVIRAAPTLTDEAWMALARHFAATHAWHEHLLLASALAAHCAPRLDDDGRFLDLVKTWLENDVGNWAQCDDLCLKPLYHYLKGRAPLRDRLPEWGASAGPWCRRASNVALVKFVGRADGIALAPVLANCARLLDDPDPYVQKGIGWVLKVAGQHARSDVLDFLARHHGHIARGTLRYALEKMPAETRRRALT